MGIELVYPRAPISGARPSPDYDFAPLTFLPETRAVAGAAATEQDSGQDTQSSTRIEARTAGFQSARERLGLDKQNDKPRPKESPELDRQEEVSAVDTVGPESLNAPNEEDVRFRAAYKRVSNVLAVVYEVPLHASPELSQQAQQLLGNIVLALGVVQSGGSQSGQQVAGTGLQKDEIFNWPLLDGLPAAETTSKKAAQALGGFLTMRQQRDGFQNLLIFSSQSGQLSGALQALVSDTDSRTDANSAETVQSEAAIDFQHQGLSSWVTRTNSLQEMLSMPALKKEVWQQLQALRKRLDPA